MIDPLNGINRPRDVAVHEGKVARLADSIHPSEATKTVDVSGLYVTPGLVDIHVHVYVVSPFVVTRRAAAWGSDSLAVARSVDSRPRICRGHMLLCAVG